MTTPKPLPLALQTFEIRPTPATLPSSQRVDELMIDLTNVPAGGTASIYLPAVSAADVLMLASGMYATHCFYPIDAHTLGCRSSGIVYLPIPRGSGANYAGLFSVLMPNNSVAPGQIYNVIARQLTAAYQGGDVRSSVVKAWRRVLGTFQLSMSVKPPKEALLATARLYAVMQWINEAIPVENRWHPVFARYLAELARVIAALGHNPVLIKASPSGQV
jgi:hypothetical protein